MKNCLVTKLKGTVDNDSLDKLGVIKMQIKAIENPNDNTNYFKLFCSKPFEIYFNGGSFYTGHYNGTLAPNPMIYNTQREDGRYGGTLYFSNTNGYIEIPKYSLLEITTSANQGNITLDFKDVKYASGMTLFRNVFSGSLKDVPLQATAVSSNNKHEITGSFGDLSDNVSLAILGLPGVTTTDETDIVELAILPTLTYLTPPNTAKGDVEKYIAAQRGIRDTCDRFTFEWAGESNIHWNGAKLKNKASLNVSWSPNSVNNSYTDIVFDGEAPVTIDANGNRV